MLNIGGAVVFCLLSLIAILGLSGKVREACWRPRIGSAHAAVMRYAIVFAGGIISCIITLELVRVEVSELIVGGAFAAVLLGIAAQQAFSQPVRRNCAAAGPAICGRGHVRMRGGAVSGQIEGIVTDIGITYVRLNTDEGPLSVPNAQVLAAAVGPLRKSSAAAGPAVTADCCGSRLPGVSGGRVRGAPVRGTRVRGTASASAAAAAPLADGTAPPAGPVTGRMALARRVPRRPRS